MNEILLDPVELHRQGFEALVKALDWVNAVRFLQQYETSRLDYTRERHQFLPKWDPQTMLQKLRETGNVTVSRQTAGRETSDPLQWHQVRRHVGL